MLCRLSEKCIKYNLSFWILSGRLIIFVRSQINNESLCGGGVNKEGWALLIKMAVWAQNRWPSHLPGRVSEVSSTFGSNPRLHKKGWEWAQVSQQYGLEFQIKTDKTQAQVNQIRTVEVWNSKAKEMPKRTQNQDKIFWLYQAVSFWLVAQVSRMEPSTRYLYGPQRATFPFTQ